MILELEINVWANIILVTSLILTLELFPKLTSNFAARKICHGVSGLLMM